MVANSERVVRDPPAFRNVSVLFKRLGPVLIAITAIGLATGAAFVALVWLDGSMGLLNPKVMRLGNSGMEPRPLSPTSESTPMSRSADSPQGLTVLRARFARHG